MNDTNTGIDMAERSAMRINSRDFSVSPGDRVELEKWPTSVKPICKSKKQYHKLLDEHVGDNPRHARWSGTWSCALNSRGSQPPSGSSLGDRRIDAAVP